MSGLGSFDAAAYDAACDRFEHNLGELKGIELIQEYWYQLVKDHSVNVGGEVNYQVRSESHPFMIVFISNIVSSREDEQTIIGYFDQQWAAGRAWAAGIGGYFRDLSERFRDVDTSAIGDAAQTLESRVALKLQGLIPDDFASDGDKNLSLAATLEHWEGGAQNGFTAFYNGVGSKVNLWSAMASAAAGLYAGHAVIMDTCQTQMQKTMEKARDHSDDQLANWAASHASWPYDSTEGAFTVVQLLDLVSLGASIASLIPPAAPVAGTVGAAAGIVSKVLSLAGEGGAGTPRNAEFKAALAFDIYRDAYDTLNLEVITPCIAAMINLRNGAAEAGNGSGDIASDIESRGSDFFTPRLEGVDTPAPGDWWFNHSAFS